MVNYGTFSPEEREQIISLTVENNPGLSREDAERIFDSIVSRRAKRNPLLERQWVRTLHAACEDLRFDRAEQPELVATVFWIRLHGTITELLSRFEISAELHRKMLEIGKHIPKLAADAEVFEACKAIRESLSEDQLVFAAFLRHVHAHVYQNGFEYRIQRARSSSSKPAKLLAKQTVSTIGRQVEVDEAHDILDRISMEHGNDSILIVKKFASIVGPHVERLEKSMAALDDEM